VSQGLTTTTVVFRETFIFEHGLINAADRTSRSLGTFNDEDRIANRLQTSAYLSR
jgi:hypothetical protein